MAKVLSHKGLLETCGMLPECLSFYVEKRKVKVSKRKKEHEISNSIFRKSVVSEGSAKNMY